MLCGMTVIYPEYVCNEGLPPAPCCENVPPWVPAPHKVGKMHLLNVQLFPEKGPDLTKYPFNLPLFHQTQRIAFTSPVTFFVGENGTGKSTLLKALANKCRIQIWKDEEGTRFDRSPYEDRLYQFIDIQWADGPVPGSFFDAEVYRNFALYVDQWAAADPGLLNYFGGKSLITQSHGQSLMSFFRARYGIKGLHLLDEPETALSPKSQIKLLKLLDKMSRTQAVQFIVATHSPILLACPRAVIFSFDKTPVSSIFYEDTHHYRIYRDFMTDRKQFLQRPD